VQFTDMTLDVVSCPPVYDSRLMSARILRSAIAVTVEVSTVLTARGSHTHGRSDAVSFGRSRDRAAGHPCSRCPVKAALDERAAGRHRGFPWNDIVVDGRGNAYVNNAGFDFPGGEFATGTVALVTPDCSVREVGNGVAFPNGMAVTSDNSTLIVAGGAQARHHALIQL
jgi:SMP-30/Gluconolactonase/LRE-like region